MTEGKLSSEKQLETNIFQVEKGKKKGFKAFLNINSLPQLFACIKEELSPLENSCLNEYELQNHLIELCFSPNKFSKFKTMKELILLEVRNNTKFWILNSDIYSQILSRSNISATTFSTTEENTLKTQDTHFEGIEAYLRYISKINTLKRKYQYTPEPESIELAKYKQETEAVLENEVKSEKMDVKENPENNQELFEKFLQFNDTQRLTRHQKKRLYDDSNLFSQDLTKYINHKSLMIRKKREEEIFSSIFMPSRFLKYPKIEFQVFPSIFRFLAKNCSALNKKLQFQLQNFIFFMLLQEKQARKKLRMNPNLYSEAPRELLPEEVGEKIPEPGGSLMGNTEETGILAEFFKFCHNEGFLVQNVFFNDLQYQSKQKILLNNVLCLGKSYLRLKEANLKGDTTVTQNLESDNLFYQGVLEDLENYENIDEELVSKVVEFYIAEIEWKKLIIEPQAETLRQFLSLNSAFQKDIEKNLMGSFTCTDKINDALEGYEQVINSPTMKKKRAYKFHSEERGEWNEVIYKKFLEGLLKFYDISINNKKIAKFIGSGISANHVKFVKGKYLRRLKRRSKELRMTAKDLLTQDSQNFDISIFEFINHNAKKI